MNIGTCRTKQAMRVVVGLILMTTALGFTQSANASGGMNFYGKNVFDGIPSGMIRDIEIVDDVIFIAAENGVFKIVGGYSERIVFNQENKETGVISDVFYDPAGYLWISEYGVGVFKYNLSSGHSYRFTVSNIALEEVWNISVTPSYAVFTLIDGVYIVSLDTQLVQQWGNQIGPKKLTNAYSLASSNSNHVVVASSHYLVEINLQKKKIQLNSINENYPNLTKITAVETTHDKIYVGGPEGVYVVDNDTGLNVFYKFKHERSIKNPIRKIFVSSSGEVWVAAGGIYKITESEIAPLDWMNPLLTSDAIYTILSINELAGKGIVLSSSQLGLIVLTDSQRAINYVSFNGSLYQKNIKSAGVSSQGSGYLNDSEHTYLLLGEQGQLVQSEPYGSSSCPGGYEQNFEEVYKKYYAPINFCDNDFNHLTLSSEGAYFAYLNINDSWKYFIVEDNEIIDEFDAPPFLQRSLLLSSGELITYDRYNNIHIQLSKYTWKTIKSVDTRWEGLNCIIELNNSYLICTSGSGLKKIDGISGKISNSHIFEKHNVRFVRAALLSKNNNLWISTNIGLFVYDVLNNNLHKLDSSHGIFDLDFEYSGIYDLSGKITLIGDRYVYTIDELKLMESLNYQSVHLPKVSIVSVKWQELDNTVELASPFISNNTLLLNDDYGEVEIVLASDNYASYEKNKLEFRILGYMDEWKVHDASHATLSVSDIGYGQYELQTRVYDATSNYQFPITRFNFDIQYPFYLQWYFILLYVVAICTLYFMYRLGYFDSSVYFVKHTRTYLFLSELYNRKTKKEALVENKIKLFRNILHELRTPLNIINSLMKNYNDDRDAKVNFNSLISNAKRMELIINQSEAFSNFNNEVNSNFRMYTIQDVYNIAISLDSLAKNKRQTLDVIIKGDGSVQLFKDSLESIISNLISNAVKFTDVGGKIKLVAIIDDRALIINVSDNGRGIDAVFHKQIFKRFSRVEPVDSAPGEGIGLSLVKDLVLINQGKIALESEVDKGSKFTITLPIDDIDEINTTSETSTMSNEWSDKSLILVVDDSREFRTHLFNLFFPYHQCLVARDGKQALNILRNHQVRLVIVDLMMTVMDGMAFIQHIRLNQRLSNIPIIVLTAKLDHELKIALLKAHVHCILIKPIPDEELLLRAEHAISTYDDSSDDVAIENETDNTHNSVSVLPELKKETDMEFYLNFISVLEQNYADHRFSRSKAAVELAVSIRKLNRALSDFGGDNFTMLLARFRVEKSIPLIIKGLSIMEVSIQVGFGTPSYFSTTFKRINGVSPKQYYLNHTKELAIKSL